MLRRDRLLALTATSCLLWPLACSDDGDGDELGTSGETQDGGDGGDGDPGDGDPGDGDPGDGDPGDGDPGDGDPGDGDGDPTAGLSVELILSSDVLREANNGGALTMRCVLFEDGLPALDQPAFEYVVTTPNTGFDVVDDTWTFPSYGTWWAGCSAEIDGEAVGFEREIAVLNDAIDERLAAVGAGLGQSAAGLVGVLASDGQDDQLLIDAIAELEAATVALQDPELDLAGLVDVLVPVPGDYPNPGVLDANGIMVNADDLAFPAALAEVNAQLDALAATYASFDPNLEPTQADLDALTAAGADLDAALTALTVLEPSAQGAITNRVTLATSIRDHLTPALLAIDGYVIARAQAEADMIFGLRPPGDDPIVTTHFGLLGLTLGMFNQSHLRVKLINEMYGDVIKELDKSINNLILSELIDYVLPPNPNGPVIDIFSASASVGFAVPGYDTWAYGSGFNSDPAYNLFLILGDQWQGVVDQILNSCGVSEDNTIPENYKALDECVEQINDAVDSSINYPMDVIEPGLLGEQDVHLGPFPQACSGFLPVVTLVVPINLAVGRGQTWQTNCLP